MPNVLKKIAAALFCGIMMMTCMLSTSALPTTTRDGRLAKYDFDTYMYPVWGDGVAYQETFVFYEDVNGKITDCTLLYTPDQIICVRSFGLTKIYREGVDYTVSGNVIKRTANSSIPYMPRTAYCNATSSESPQLQDNPDGGALISDNKVMEKYYCAISYTHSDSFQGKIPTSEIDHLATFKAKLEAKQPVTIAILGDSISAGYSTSGLNELSYRTNGQQTTIKVNCAPYMPTWPVLVKGMIEKVYGYTDVTVVNCAVGGTNTNSACLADMKARVVAANPDLVIVGFGMNEYWAPANQHGDRIEGVCDDLHKSLPNAGFVLLSSMTPNIIARDESTFNFAGFEKEYYGIQKDRATDLQIAVAPLNTVYSAVRSVKNDFDLVGGNNNHPNDYTVRLYAQTVSAVLGLYDTPYFRLTELADGQVNTAYTATVASWCAIDQTLTVEGLPEGLTYADGSVSGTPTVSGTFEVTLTATSDKGATTVKSTLVIEPEATEAPTEAPAEESPKGCGSTLLGATLPAILTATALTKKKKKHD